MKNKAVIVTITEVSFAGEILGDDLIDGGILFKPSDKSDIKMWFPLEEIKKIVLPNTHALTGEKLSNVYEELKKISEEYGLEEVE